MPQAFAYNPGDELPTGWKTLSKNKFLIPGSLESDVVADLRKDGFALGFGWVLRIFVEDG